MIHKIAINFVIYGRKNFSSSIIERFFLLVLKSFVYSVHTFSTDHVFHSEYITYTLCFHVSNSNFAIFQITV